MSSLSRLISSPTCVLALKAAVLTGALMCLPATPAAAGDWCGFRSKSDSLVDCGYSTYAKCRDGIGDKAAVCIPDPDYAALHGRRDPLAG